MRREDEGEQRLEALLQDWAVRHMLPVARANSIRLAVLQMPEPAATEPGVAWWHRLFGTLDVVLGQTTDMFRYLRYQQTV